MKAWDNFDCFVATDSGKDTLHDTVGIAYQLSKLTITENVDSQVAATTLTTENIDFQTVTSNDQCPADKSEKS